MSLRIESGVAPSLGREVYRHRMPSRLDRKADAIDGVVDFLRQAGWVSQSDVHWLTLCLDEVVVNAMLHGNEGDPSLYVDLRIFDAEQRWVLQVDDQGEGFRAEQVPDPDDDSSLLLEHGRGILIMSQWLDDLKYYQGGSCAVLCRRKDVYMETADE